MTKEEMMALSDEELRKLSMQKTKRKKTATRDALRAQQLIWERSGCPYGGKYVQNGSVYVGDGNRTTKQYHYKNTSRDLR